MELRDSIGKVPTCTYVRYEGATEGCLGGLKVAHRRDRQHVSATINSMKILKHFERLEAENSGPAPDYSQLLARYCGDGAKTTARLLHPCCS